MKGMRKVIIGIVFILSASFIAYAGIKEHSELLGLSTVIGAIAVGVGTVIWGNAKEHESASTTPTPAA